MTSIHYIPVSSNCEPNIPITASLSNSHGHALSFHMLLLNSSRSCEQVLLEAGCDLQVKLSEISQIKKYFGISNRKSPKYPYSISFYIQLKVLVNKYKKFQIG